MHAIHKYARFAREFFVANEFAFWEMQNANALVGNAKNDNTRYCLAKTGGLYLVYLPEGGTSELDLGAATGAFRVRWFNPRGGGAAVAGAIQSVTGGGSVALGNPPADPGEDWLAIVRQ